MNPRSSDCKADSLTTTPSRRCKLSLLQLTWFCRKLQKSVKGHFSPGLHLSPHMFLVSHDAKYLFAAGFWDNSIRVMSLRGKAVFSLVRHLGKIDIFNRLEATIEHSFGDRNTWSRCQNLTQVQWVSKAHSAFKTN